MERGGTYWLQLGGEVPAEYEHGEKKSTDGLCSVLYLKKSKKKKNPYLIRDKTSYI